MYRLLAKNIKTQRKRSVWTKTAQASFVDFIDAEGFVF